MLTARAASWRLSLGFLLALTSAVSAVAAAAAGPASADSVRDAQQWVLDAVNAPAAWPVTQGQGVTVAVIDSGVNPAVSDLVGSVITGPDYSGVSTPPSNPEWGMHGTWMASLIAGHGHGFDSGVSGVAPRAMVLSIRVLPDKKDPAYKQYEQEPASDGQRALAKAIRFAVRHRVGVISMSLGYSAASKVVRSALQDAYQHKIVVVASAGNSGDKASNNATAHAPYSYPADYPGVLAVAAVNKAGNPAYFSSDNLSVQVAAPGVRVLAQGNNGQYWLVNGTSPACALAAGVAALIKSVHPGMSPALVVQAIGASAQHPPGGYNDRVGFGTVNAAAALTAATRLAKYGPRGRGIRTSTHFGGGRAAIPPPPVRARGLEQLVLFCLLAAACLALTVVAASRLILARAHGPGRPGPVLAMARSAVRQPYVTGPSAIAPDEAAPGDASPDDAGADTIALDAIAPGDTPPGDAAPGDAAPGDAPPGDAAPGDAAPGDAAQGRAAPGRAARYAAGPDAAGPAATAPYATWSYDAGLDAVSVNGASQGGSPADHAAPAASALPSPPALPGDQPGDGWSWDRDIVASDEDVTPAQPQPGQADDG